MAKYTINMIPKRRTALINAWREFAADESFAGMTLAEFEAQTLPVVTIRTEIEQTLAKLAGQRRVRNALDAEMQTKIPAVVNTVPISCDVFGSAVSGQAVMHSMHWVQFSAM